MSDNLVCEKLLATFHKIGLAVLPFPDDTDVSATYAAALGLIAGIAAEALLSVREGRQAHFERKAP